MHELVHVDQQTWYAILDALMLAGGVAAAWAARHLVPALIHALPAMIQMVPLWASDKRRGMAQDALFAAALEASRAASREQDRLLALARSPDSPGGEVVTEGEAEQARDAGIAAGVEWMRRHGVMATLETVLGKRHVAERLDEASTLARRGGR